MILTVFKKLKCYKRFRSLSTWKKTDVSLSYWNSDYVTKISFISFVEL